MAPPDVTHPHRKTGFACIAVSILIVLGGCHKRTASEQAMDAAPADAAPAADHTVSVGIHKHTDGQAVEIAQKFVAQRGGSAVVRAPYTETQPRRIPCSQIEVERDRSAYPSNPELWTCKSSPGGDMYFKSSPVTESRCCEDRRVQLPGNASWTSSYNEAEKAWYVRAEFEIGDQRQKSEWVVNDETGAVTERSDQNAASR